MLFFWVLVLHMLSQTFFCTALSHITSPIKLWRCNLSLRSRCLARSVFPNLPDMASRRKQCIADFAEPPHRISYYVVTGSLKPPSGRLLRRILFRYLSQPGIILAARKAMDTTEAIV